MILDHRIAGFVVHLQSSGGVDNSSSRRSYDSQRCSLSLEIQQRDLDRHQQFQSENWSDFSEVFFCAAQCVAKHIAATTNSTTCTLLKLVLCSSIVVV
jgi:hypothetical protein